MSPRLAVSVGRRYRLEQLLGQGGMGSVYRAYDRLTRQRVALKFVPVNHEAGGATERERDLPGNAKTMALSLEVLASRGTRASSAASGRSLLDETMAAEMQTVQPGHSSRVHIAVGSAQSSANALWTRLALAQEFRTLASVRHPHIIAVLDYGFVARSQPFFTMELLENARSLSTASKGLPQEQKAQLLAQLLRALSYLHRHGILHRDLKPANVMVVEGSEGLEIKLLDFGLALMRSHVQPQPTEILGTLSYMAPELFEGKAASEATDLFAVGVMAYELFTRRHPFDRGDEGQLIASILGSDPDWRPLEHHAALKSLLRRLLAKSPTARPSADEAIVALAEAIGIPIPQETGALRENTLAAARFVGREEPLAKLRAAMDAARAGRGDVWLLGGESGVGKSRLMEELHVYSLVQGTLSAQGQGVSEGGGAFGIWREILRTMCLYTELDELDASVLKSILPDLEVLLERAIPDAPALNPQAAQLRLVRVIESVFLRQTEPLLLLLEDLHWADADTLMLLRRLASSCRARPILILASYRDDERPNLPQELPDWEVLKLGRFSAQSIAELCQSMLGEHGYTQELVKFLESETEGNIFFIIEMLRALAEEAGQLSLVASRLLPKNIVTGGIQAIVQRRLSRLPEEGRPLLQLAAVAGRQLDLAVLRNFEPKIEPWLYMAADAAVLEVSDQAWRFAHDKIRESLLLALVPSERERLHLLLARAIESTYPGSAPHASALAEHYQRGGHPAKAAFYQVEAGVHALSQGATEQAAVLLKQALAPEGLALLPRAQAARAYNCLIQAKVALGWVMPCVAIYEQFMEQIGNPMPGGILSMAAAGSAMLTRRLRRRPSVALVTEEDRRIWSDIAHATRWACEAYVWVGQPIKSIVAALRGAELAEALGDIWLRSYFLAVFGYLAGLVPLRAASRMFLERGSRLLAGYSDSRAKLDFSRVASVQNINAANWALAKLQIDALIALSRQVGDPYSLMFGLSQRLLVAFRQEEESVFESAGPELYDRARRNQSEQFSRVYPLYKGLKSLRRGDAENAQGLFSEAEGYLQKTKDLIGRILLGGLVALCLLRQGEREAALLRARHTMALVETTRLSNEVVGEGIAAIVEMYLSLWESGSAADRRQFVRPLRRSLSALRRCAQIFPSSAPRALLWHGRAAWNQGAVRVARRLGEASRRSAKRLGMPYEEALARTWIERFAEATPGADTGLAGELRGVLQLLARGLGQTEPDEHERQDRKSGGQGERAAPPERRDQLGHKER